jgi:hypothetical protein
MRNIVYNASLCPLPRASSPMLAFDRLERLDRFERPEPTASSPFEFVSACYNSRMLAPQLLSNGKKNACPSLSPLMSR